MNLLKQNNGRGGKCQVAFESSEWDFFVGLLISIGGSILTRIRPWMRRTLSLNKFFQSKSVKSASQLISNKEMGVITQNSAHSKCDEILRIVELSVSSRIRKHGNLPVFLNLFCILFSVQQSVFFLDTVKMNGTCLVTCLN